MGSTGGLGQLQSETMIGAKITAPQIGIFDMTIPNITNLTYDFVKYQEARHGRLWIGADGPQAKSWGLQIAGRESTAPRRVPARW